jgi:AcrR family transcriptional regulator
VPHPTASGATYTPAQHRTISAALELFGQHGVSGTSLQMIADALGVTKAAVYHQFHTKEEIVLAVTDVELGQLVAALDAAAAEPSPIRARELLLGAVIDLAVRRRRWVHVLQNDPVIIRLLGEHAPFLELMDRLYGVLLGEEPADELRVQTALASAAVGAAVVHPLVADLDDEALRAELIRVTRRLMDFPDEDAPTPGRPRRAC